MAAVSSERERTDAPSAPSPLAGSWIDNEDTPWEITVSGNRISGTITVAGQRSLPISGTVNGKNFDVNFVDYGGRNNSASCVLHSEREASCNWQASGRFYLFAPTSGVWKLTKR
jgi:hypothetical protein